MSVQRQVFLVGAGPGDPGLLTLRAKELIETADIIIHDRLVSQEILDFAKREAELIYVGKRPGHHCVPQSKINQIIVELALEGGRVVRLKGGDPLIFGRGGEEAAVLKAHGISCEIVPGITAAQGAAASLGIPLSQRGTNTSVRYITGHLRDRSELDGREWSNAYDWKGLSDPFTTLVVYMGTSTIHRFAAQLQRQGRSPATPSIAIASATLGDQRFVRAELEKLAKETRRAGLTGPVLFIIGEVVDLAEHLNQVEREPHADLVYEAAAYVAAQ